MNKSLSLDDFLKLDDTEYTTITIPEWNNVEVRLRSITAKDMIEWTERNDGEEKKTAAARLFVLCWVNDKGERQVTGEAAEAVIKKVENLRHSAIDRIYSALSKLNNLGKQAPEEAKNASSAASSDVQPTDSQSS